jgi:DNA end-binding protein Ku
MTLRYPYEVRKEDEYFEDIPDEKIPKDMLELASHIIETKSGHFEPEKFEDQYEDALKELLKKKQAGEKIEAPRERAPAKVINLMDALRRSVEAERGGGERRKALRAEWRQRHQHEFDCKRGSGGGRGLFRDQRHGRCNN